MLLECPHCGQASMSSWQKLFLGPASSTSCKACGKGVTIRWRHALILLIPAALVMLTMKMFELPALQFLGIGLLLIAIAALIQLHFIPLSRAENGQ